MRKIYLFISFYFLTSVYAVGSSTIPEAPELSIEKFCSEYSGGRGFMEDLSQKILKDNHQRFKLVQLMKNKKAQGCANALTEFLNSLEADGPKGKKPGYFQSFLVLAYAANLPVATKIMEQEINEGNLMTWLDVLEKQDKLIYFKSLSLWVHKMAVLLRQVGRANLVDVSQYGKNSGIQNDSHTPESIPIWNPVFNLKYMEEVSRLKMKLSIEDLNDLNIIFATSNQSYRDIFLKNMSVVISLSEKNWITSFRQEPSWVEFRLFPVMEKVGGGMMKRELIWLSNYHESFKIRSLALSTLEKVNARFSANPLNSNY